MKLKLKLIEKHDISVRDYSVPCNVLPKGTRPSDIRIKLINGIYQYVPRRFTFAVSTRFQVSELQLIIDKLKRLNKVK